MGELRDKAFANEHFKTRSRVTKGKRTTVWNYIYGCKRLDRMVAHYMMKKQGITHINKKRGDSKNGKYSYFSTHWRQYHAT
jgi:hypothetical protein